MKGEAQPQAEPLRLARHNANRACANPSKCKLQAWQSVQHSWTQANTILKQWPQTNHCTHSSAHNTPQITKQTECDCMYKACKKCTAQTNSTWKQRVKMGATLQPLPTLSLIKWHAPQSTQQADTTKSPQPQSGTQWENTRQDIQATGHAGRQTNGGHRVSCTAAGLVNGAVGALHAPFRPHNPPEHAYS